jgi:hypothetical protein
MKVLIIIPAYNEQENIERVVNHLIKDYSQYDYVVINDGSKDKTSQICHENHYNYLSFYHILYTKTSFTHLRILLTISALPYKHPMRLSSQPSDNHPLISSYNYPEWNMPDGQPLQDSSVYTVYLLHDLPLCFFLLF